MTMTAIITDCCPQCLITHITKFPDNTQVLVRCTRCSDRRITIDPVEELPEQYGGIVPNPNVKGEFMPWPGIPKTNETGGK